MLYRIKQALFNLSLGALTVVFGFSFFFIFFFPERIRCRFIFSGWCPSIIWLAKHLLGIKYQVHGLQHLLSSPSVVLSNHQSAWETFFFAHFLFPVSFVLKRELHFIPIFGWVLSRLPMIAIQRQQRRRSMHSLLQGGKRRLQRGWRVLIFPEGTRIPPDQQVPYKLGGARLAIEAQVPITPIAINSGLFWRKKHQCPGTIQVVIGPPIYPEDHDALTLSKAAETWIRKTLHTLI